MAIRHHADSLTISQALGTRAKLRGARPEVLCPLGPGELAIATDIFGTEHEVKMPPPPKGDSAKSTRTDVDVFPRAKPGYPNCAKMLTVCGAPIVASYLRPARRRWDELPVDKRD